jgi:transposase InsO family protein
VWTSDTGYLRAGQGWLYLCAVRDGCSRRVIGWTIDEHMRTDPVESALTMAGGQLAACDVRTMRSPECIVSVSCCW